jgi:hypothetical protein
MSEARMTSKVNHRAQDVRLKLNLNRATGSVRRRGDGTVRMRALNRNISSLIESSAAEARQP